MNKKIYLIISIYLEKKELHTTLFSFYFDKKEAISDIYNNRLQIYDLDMDYAALLEVNEYSCFSTNNMIISNLFKWNNENYKYIEINFNDFKYIKELENSIEYIPFSQQINIE